MFSDPSVFSTSLLPKSFTKHFGCVMFWKTENLHQHIHCQILLFTLFSVMFLVFHFLIVILILCPEFGFLLYLTPISLTNISPPHLFAFEKDGKSCAKLQLPTLHHAIQNTKAFLTVGRFGSVNADVLYFVGANQVVWTWFVVLHSGCWFWLKWKKKKNLWPKTSKQNI